MILLKSGKKAPKFKLPDQQEQIVDLNTIDTDYTIIFFYPKDNTPGCTIEANDFSSALKTFKKLNATVLGVSGLTPESKQKFCKQHNIKATLLSDTDFKVSSKYGVYGEKKFMGKRFQGIKRTTFILDRDKKILKVYENVKARGHVEEVLEFISAAATLNA